MSGIGKIVDKIRADVEAKVKCMEKRLKDGLANLVSCMLCERTSNLMVLAEALPRDISKNDHRYQYISRFLKNPNVDRVDVMRPYTKEVFENISTNDQTIVLMMDQSKMIDGFEVLMISVRVGDRALPVIWCVEKTEGNIGFESQEKLLNHVLSMLPEKVPVILMADRFYGHKALIQWCIDHNFSYRIRLKGNILFDHEGTTISAQDAYDMGLYNVENAGFKGSKTLTNIGIIHDKGHKEPWFIAMDCAPNQYKTLDYGMRWGIESMFSDFKSRGFGVTHSHLTHADRLERLILIMSLALYWATSTGMFLKVESPPAYAKKKP